MLSSPNLTLRTVEPDAPLESSIGYAVLAAVVGLCPTFLMMIPFLVAAQLMAPKDGPPGMAVFMVVGVFIYLGMALAFTIGSVFFVSGIEHLALRALGAEPKRFTVTVRAYALGMSSYLLGVIPFCSFYVFPIWAIVLRIIALMHLHKTTPGKASAAVLLPVLLLCGGFLGLYVAVIALAMSFAR